MSGDHLVTIWEPTVPEGFEWVIFDRSDDVLALVDLDADPAGSTWESLPVHLLTHDEATGKRLSPAELPWLANHVLCLRDDAIVALTPLLEPFGELLPLTCPDARIVVFHPSTVLDVLDEDRSELVRFSSGRIMVIERYAFKPHIVSPPQAFKIPQKLRGSVLLTEDLVRSIEECGFQGTAFRQVGEPVAAKVHD